MFYALVIVSLSIPLYAIQYPSPPQEPNVAQPQGEIAPRQSGSKKNKQPVSVPRINVRLRIHLGDKSVLLAEAQIPATYSFSHKKGRLQYAQTIRAEDIRELTVEKYRGRKVSTAADGDLYEFEPADIRIELKDGQVFNLPYLFKDMRKLKAHNADGNFSVFAFFADTLKPHVGWQERPLARSGNIREGNSLISKYPHPAAFTRLEYFDPVDKAGATDDVEKASAVPGK